MATAGLAKNERSYGLDLKVENIEYEVVKRMSWSRKVWEEKGETDSKLKRLINSMRYWHKKLLNAIGDTSLVLTLFEEEGEARVQALDIIDAVVSLGYGHEIEGYSDFRNPRYLAFHFKSAQAKKWIETNLRKVGTAFVVYLHWASQPEIINVKAHWLPMGHDIQNIKAIIEKQIEIVEIIKDKTTLMSGMEMKRGLLTFCGKLKEGKTIEMLPHIAVVDGFECLVTTYGRDPICLTCNIVGHRSASCPTPFCKKCSGLHGKKEPCSENSGGRDTYAQRLKNDKNYQDNLVAAMEACEDSDTSLSYTQKHIVNKVKVEGEYGYKAGGCVLKEKDLNNDSVAEHEISDSDSVHSEEDESLSNKGININETFSKMSNYFTELQNLNKSKVVNTLDFKLPDCTESSDWNEDSTGAMDISFNLKRKSDIKIKKHKEVLQAAGAFRGIRGSRRTYSKSNVNAPRAIDLSNNLFDNLTKIEEED